MDSPDHEEVLRSRDRIHKLEGAIAAANYSLQEQTRLQRELSRRLGRVEGHLARLRQAVEDMSQADDIAVKVTAALKQRRGSDFTIIQRVAGALLALIVAAPAVKLIVDWLTG